MDEDTYVRYEQFGTFFDERGRPIPCSPRKTLTELTEQDLAVYYRLTDPVWTRVRRIEQEKISLADGLEAVSA